MTSWSKTQLGDISNHVEEYVQSRMLNWSEAKWNSNCCVKQVLEDTRRECLLYRVRRGRDPKPWVESDDRQWRTMCPKLRRAMETSAAAGRLGDVCAGDPHGTGAIRQTAHWRHCKQHRSLQKSCTTKRLDNQTSSRECLVIQRGQNAEDNMNIRSSVSNTRKRTSGRTGARRIPGRCRQRKTGLRSSGPKVEEDGMTWTQATNLGWWRRQHVEAKRS